MFEITPNVDIERDNEGKVRHISHLQEPYMKSEEPNEPVPQVLAVHMSEMWHQFTVLTQTN